MTEAIYFIIVPFGPFEFLTLKNIVMDYSYDFPKSKFYQSLMTAFFVGFFATVL